MLKLEEKSWVVKLKRAVGKLERLRKDRFRDFTERMVPTGFDPAAVREGESRRMYTKSSGGKGGSHLGAA